MDTKNQNLELVNVAIQKLLGERKNREELGDSFIEDGDDDELLLSRLLSQLESLKSHRAIQQPEISKELSDLGKSMSSQIENADQSDGSVVDTEEIVKELKKVKRQNSITHWLLSVMLVLTVTWQISEVSLFFKLKNGLNHPFRYLGGMFTGMLKGSDMKDQDEQKQNQLDYTLACVSI